MNWIVGKSSRIRFHTDLQAITAPFRAVIKNYQWLISDLDFIYNGTPDLPVNLEEDVFLLPGEEFERLVDSGVQLVWAAILALPYGAPFNHTAENFPFVEGNPAVWEAGVFQREDAEIEIDCFDSSYTVVKFRDNVLSEQFHAGFPEAISLLKFRSSLG